MAKNFDPGRLRFRVRFDRLQGVPDSNGNLQDQETGALRRDWVPVLTVWADIVDASVGEFVRGGAVQQEWRSRIETRYHAELADTTDMRAVHVVNGQDQTIYEIAGPVADYETRYDWMNFPAKAGMTGGE